MRFSPQVSQLLSYIFLRLLILAYWLISWFSLKVLPLRSRFKRPILYCWVKGDYGSPSRFRTCNPPVNSRMLCRWAIGDYKLVLPAGLEPATEGLKVPNSTNWVTVVWLGDRDSNPDQRHQKPRFCHWTIAQNIITLFRVDFMVGLRGFEPPTTWTQTRCATKLRYNPIKKDWVRFKLTTCGLINALLYLLSYQSIIHYIIKIISSMIFRIIWHHQRGLNSCLGIESPLSWPTRRWRHGGLNKTWTCDLSLIRRVL